MRARPDPTEPDPTEPDPTEHSRWRALFEMLQRMDAEIEGVYAEAGFTGVRARFILPLVRLSRRGPSSIKDLAAACGVTHSGMSQTVAIHSPRLRLPILVMFGGLLAAEVILAKLFLI